MAKKSKRAVIEKFVAIRRMAAEFATRCDFSPIVVKGIKKAPCICSGDLAYTTLTLRDGSDTAQTFTAFVYAAILHGAGVSHDADQDVNREGMKTATLIFNIK